MAGRYSGVISILNSLSKGLQAINALKPAAFKHRALSVFGSDARFSLVAGTSFMISDFKTTPVRPLSCNDDSIDGS